MAEIINKKYLDLAGLEHYNTKLQTKMAADDAATLVAAKAYTDEEVAKANGSVDALTEKLYGKGESEAHVKGDLDEINAAIAAEQERAEDAEEDIMDFIGEIPEDAEAETVIGYVDEVVAAEEAARKAQIGELGKVSEEEGTADHTVKSYVDAKVEEINGDADALEDRIEALEATHATKEDGSFKTVSEEVNEAVTDLIDGAPAALDTLKEIADWIAEQGEADEDGAAQLVSKIEKNATVIAEEKTRAEGAESDLQDAIDAEVERAEGAEEDLQDAIDALDEKLYGTGEGEEHVKGDVDKIQDRLNALETSTADADALKALENKLYGEDKVVEGETTHVDGDLEKINAKIDAFVRITEDEIDALFEDEIKGETQSV